LVVENDTIYIEDLNIKSMLETASFNVKKSNIADASWGSFAAILTYKAERAGKLVVKVDPRNTSKMCSGCRSIKKDLALTDRIYHCIACGNAMNRDVNAAKNIKRLGISLILNPKV
jgi:putative transposase